MLVVVYFGTYSSVFFAGGFYVVQVLFLLFLFVVVRAALPRFRYDQLMDISWKILFPHNLAFLVFVASVFLLFVVVGWVV